MGKSWGEINDENIAESIKDFHIYKKTFVQTEYGLEPCITTLIVPSGAKIHFPMNKSKEFLKSAKMKEIRGKIRVDKAIVESNLCSPWIGFAAKFKHYFPETAKKYNKSAIFQKKQVDEVLSGFDWSFKYETGKIVRPKKCFYMRDDDCASGIHGFFDKNDAKKYEF